LGHPRRRIPESGSRTPILLGGFRADRGSAISFPPVPPSPVIRAGDVFGASGPAAVYTSRIGGQEQSFALSVCSVGGHLPTGP
jgi:hypothetical protein